jgi:hypothetical protein
MPVRSRTGKEVQIMFKKIVALCIGVVLAVSGSTIVATAHSPGHHGADRAAAQYSCDVNQCKKTSKHKHVVCKVSKCKKTKSHKHSGKIYYGKKAGKDKGSRHGGGHH